MFFYEKNLQILTEEVLHSLEDILILDALGLLEVRLFGKLLDKFLLVGAERGWNSYIHHNKDITSAIAIDLRQSLATPTQHLASVCSRSYLNRGLTLDGWHLDLATENRSHNGDIEVVDEVVTIAYKLGIALLLDNHNQIAIDTTSACGITLALNSESHSLGNASGHSNLDNIGVAYTSLTSALVTLVCDDATFATAMRADRLRLHTTKEGVLHSYDIARAITLRAGRVG